MLWSGVNVYRAKYTKILDLFFGLIWRAKIDVLFEAGFHKKVMNSAWRIQFKFTFMLIPRYLKYIKNTGFRRKENSSFTILFTLSLNRFMILYYAVNLKVLLLSINNKWKRTCHFPSNSNMRNLEWLSGNHFQENWTFKSGSGLDFSFID